ncbi:MAG: FHA domain-containing protein [Actinomycetia bacterium]|nr:FHA domain-containing protein [Actinomycetes bacterium]MCP4224935.1 FHA domain-containing protein [Actinomycetes bacterium]MCP5035497.1 FHA domain-containing protein [Actinomycetes bacterium]
MAEQRDVIVIVRQPGRQALAVLLEGELDIGRDCDGLLLADEEVSRRHLTLRRHGPAVQITDLGSTNGTFVNGAPLIGSQIIDPTSRVVLGDSSLSIEMRGRGVGPGSPRTTTISKSSGIGQTSIDVVADTMSTNIASLGAEVFDGETISIVFSDIEGSTQRATDMGDREWFRLLDEHNQVFRSELTRCGGREVKSIGDGFMLTFPSVRRAIRFASRVQQAVEADEGPNLRVRMGVHTGEAIVDQTGDLFGRHVNLAARVANLATGGQILASLVVHEIATGRHDISFGEPMVADLQGFNDPETVYEVLWRKATL